MIMVCCVFFFFANEDNPGEREKLEVLKRKDNVKACCLLGFKKQWHPVPKGKDELREGRRM